MEPPTATERDAIVKFYLGDKASTSVESFSAFLAFYRRATSSQAFRFTTLRVDDPMLTSHSQLQQLVQQLRDNPSSTRKEFEANAFTKDGIREQELQHAIKVIVKLGFMLDCTQKDVPSKSAYQRNVSCWEPDRTFTDFVASSFPNQKMDDEHELDDLPSIYAWKLKQRCSMNFEKTDDISEHLLYNRDTRTLKIFHQMAYLRMQLQRHTCPIEDLSLEESLKRGTLPPQLILETLQSFYELLFPMAPAIDKKGRSRRLLRRLVMKKGFDPQVFIGSHSRWLSEDFTYMYWGDRLKELGELLKKPPPTTNWMTWLEERTSERNALMIAIAGLFLSALFGLLGCIIGVAQLWIAILAWKAPVPPSSG